jgi:hypothetical protein
MAAESPSPVFLPRPLPTLLSLLFVLLLVAPSIQSPPPKNMSKPTIVLVPGAWHQPAHYSALIGMLESASYEVVTEKLPSVDSSTPTQQSVPNDATFIEKHLLRPLVDQGKDILLLMHSYGGCPGADAAKGYSKKERTVAGKKGGIIGLVFMAAFLANEGDSLLSKLPNQEYDPWVVWNVIIYAHLPSVALLGKRPADALTLHRRKRRSSTCPTPRTSSTTMSMIKSPKSPSRSSNSSPSRLYHRRAAHQPGQTLSTMGRGRTYKRRWTTRFRLWLKMLWSLILGLSGTSRS